MIWTWRLKELKSLEVRQDMSQNLNWSKLSSYCRRGKNLNSKEAVSLVEDVGDKRFPMEELLFVAVSFF